MHLTPIGIIHSPHQRAEGTPVQAALATGVQGTVEVFPEYAAGLRDLDGFERVWLVYWFDRAKPAELVVTPYLDTTPRGLFATRAPCRPNPIGLSSVRLLGSWQRSPSGRPGHPRQHAVAGHQAVHPSVRCIRSKADWLVWKCQRWFRCSGRPVCNRRSMTDKRE